MIYSYERVDLGMKSRHRLRPERIDRESSSALYLESGDRMEFSHMTDSGGSRVYSLGLKKVILTGREDVEGFDEETYDELSGTNQIYTR